MLFADIDKIIDCAPIENPQTNADRIRSMTDDELNELFHEIYGDNVQIVLNERWSGSRIQQNKKAIRKL